MAHGKNNEITPVTIRKALAQDADLLAPVAAQTFRDGWANIITPLVAEAYIAEALSASRLAEEITDPAHYLAVAVDAAGAIVGYAKLVRGRAAPAFVTGDAPVLLQRMYVAAEYRGAGVADDLLTHCIREALRRGADTLYLETDPRNDRAWRFYVKRGYKDVGGASYALPGAVNDQVRVLEKRIRPTIRAATSGDAKSLSWMASAVFVDAFAANSDPAALHEYLTTAFHPDTIEAELRNPDNLFLLAMDDAVIIGYAKLCFASDESPECIPFPPPYTELERFYVRSDWQGMGVADMLMKATLEAARQRGGETIWLGVYEINHRARRFYTRWGFTDVGEHIFMLGSKQETDRVMVRKLPCG